MIKTAIPSNPQAATHLIILMGVSGCGKSSLAHALAVHYGYTYLDGDDFHSQAARRRMAQGKPLSFDLSFFWFKAPTLR